MNEWPPLDEDDWNDFLAPDEQPEFDHEDYYVDKYEQRGSLDARLSMTIRQIVKSRYFDQQDLIKLLKDLQRERRDMKVLFDSIVQDCRHIDEGLQALKSSPMAKRQA